MNFWSTPRFNDLCNFRAELVTTVVRCGLDATGGLWSASERAGFDGKRRNSAIGAIRWGHLDGCAVQPYQAFKDRACGKELITVSRHYSGG